MSIRFDNRVAIVTGAGGGLGRTYALELARRGAKVMVNDLGGAMDGTGGSSDAAKSVVAEIEALGGQAISNGASVSDAKGAQSIIDDTMNAFGRVDILINNAGILRDKSFAKVSLEDWRAVVEVHLMGSMMCTHAAWPHMRQQQYGRILMTTSPTGLYGNFGQTNYGAAKLGLVGFMLSLKEEGAKDNIHVNTISPVATTRMTIPLMSEQAQDMFAPELVMPSALYLVSEEAPTSMILAAGGGVVTRAQIYETQGAFLGAGHSVDDVAANIEKIKNTDGMTPLQNGGGQGAKFGQMIAAGTKGS